MFPEGLHHAEAPTHALLDKLPHVFRCLCHGHGIVLVLDDITGFVDAHRQVAVLSQCVGGQSAGALDGFLAESTNSAGHHGDGIDIGVGHAVEVLTGGVFDGLPAREHVALVADLDVSGHGTDAVVLVEQEVLHELANSIRAQLGIGIDAHDIFRIGMGNTVVQSRSLATIGLAEDAHLVVAVESLMDALQRPVLTAIINEIDVEGRIVLMEQCLHGAHAVDLLVVGGYDD